MTTISYDALNDLVHEIADAIVKTTGIPRESFNLVALNDQVTAYLGDYGVLFEEAEDMPGALEPTFWQAVNLQLLELKSATSADVVLEILSAERNPYRDPTMIAGHGFFAGGGGDYTPADSLLEAGWRFIWREAPYHYALRAPDGSAITYVEGDVYRGDQRAG